MACACKSGSPTEQVKQVVKKIHQPRPTSKAGKKIGAIRKVVYRRPMWYYSPTLSGILIAGYDLYPSILMSSYLKLSISA